MTSPSSAITTTVYVWDGQSLVQERNQSNLLLAQYTWAPETWDGFWSGGELMDVLLLERRASTPGDMANGVSRYHGEDPSYNTRLLIDSSGNVTDRFSFKAYGEVWQRSGNTPTPFLFGGAVGYFFDALRRTYVRNRVVDPTTGRWVSPDPIGFLGGDWNLFGYVGNTPINKIDSSGKVSPIIIIVNPGLGAVIGIVEGIKACNTQIDINRCRGYLVDTRRFFSANYGCYFGQRTTYGVNIDRCNDDYALCVHHCLMTGKRGRSLSILCRNVRNDSASERVHDNFGVSCGQQGNKTLHSCYNCCSKHYSSPILPNEYD